MSSVTDYSITKQQLIDRVIHSHLPWEVRGIYDLLCYSARRSHIHCQGDIGSGKSSLLALIAYQDLLLGFPVVVIDPNETLTNYLLMLIINTPHKLRRMLLRKVRLVDMSGQTSHIIPLSLYYHLGHESLGQIAARPVNVIDRMHPELINAPISGIGAINMIGKYSGVIMYALGLGITETEDLLDNPKNWIYTLKQLANQNPASEIQKAVQFFTTTYIEQWMKHNSDNRTISFRQHIFDLTFSDNRRILYGASRPGIDFQQIREERLCVIFYCSTELDDMSSRFNINWILDNVLQETQYTGNKGRNNPESLILDETSRIWFAPQHKKEMNQILNQLARNNGLMITGANQSSRILDPDIDESWRQTPTTQIIGSTRSHKTAMAFAEMFHPYDETMKQHVNIEWVQKRSESKGRTDGETHSRTFGESSSQTTGDSTSSSYGDETFKSGGSSTWSRSSGTSKSETDGKNYSKTHTQTENTFEAIDTRPVFHTVEQQRELAANKFKTLPSLNFYCKVARWEGDGIGKILNLSLAGYTRNMQPDHDKLAILKQYLIETYGRPREDILAEIEERKGIDYTLPSGTMKHGNSVPTPNSDKEQTNEGIGDDYNW